MISLEEIKGNLKKNLSDYRFNHCLRVADVASDLAKCYGYDEDKAYLAGLVHDIAKEYSDEENLKILENAGFCVDDIDVFNGRFAHSVVGAFVLKQRYGMDDDICHAVSCHTYGAIPMNLLDKILFVADKIEPGKDYDGIAEERRLAFFDLDLALILCIENNHKKMKRQGKEISSKSIEVLEYLKRNS